MSYLQSLTDYLSDADLLTADLKSAMKAHDAVYKTDRKKSVRMTWGSHKGKTVQEIYEFKPEYLVWLGRQQFVKEKFTDIYAEVVRLMGP